MQNIILLHGALGSKEDLLTLSKELNMRGINVFSFSFSGHGRCPFNEKFGIETFTLELENFILEHNLKNTSIFGYSMGGYIALNLSLKRTDLIKNIITLGTKFNWNEHAVEKETRILNPNLMQEKIPSYVDMLKTKHGSDWKELVEKTAQMMKDIGNKNYLNSQTLKNIKHKVLIGLGDKDQMVGFDETIMVYQALPKGAMFVLPNTKHSLETIDSNFLCTIILNFITKP